MATLLEHFDLIWKVAAVVFFLGGFYWQIRELQKFRKSHDRDEEEYRNKCQQRCDERHRHDVKIRMVLSRLNRLVNELHTMTGGQSAQTIAMAQSIQAVEWRMKTLEASVEAIREHLGAPVLIPPVIQIQKPPKEE